LVHVVNQGQSPAINTVSEVRVAIAPTPFFSDWESIPDQNPALIAPSTLGTAFSSTPLVVSPGSTAAYKSGDYRVWITGRITYTDIFKADHWIDFCAFHESGRELKEFRFCQTGNGVDENN
jgi:hypothetical protein